MSQVYVGSIILFAGNFAIRNFAMCNGQILAISQNQALFALIATTYGGNGTSTFALPDLRSRVPLHFGQGVGLSNYVLGQAGGVENVSLSLQQMPQHNHMINAQNGPGTAPAANGNYLATTSTKGATPYYDTYASSVTSATQLNGSTVSSNGSSQPHPNIQPYLALNYQIALLGIFPSRN